jgi:putative tryptophan/tyrosine transport system substrate-binding protein
MTLTSRSQQVAVFALRQSLPTISESRNGVAAGLLMSYGPNQAETFRHAGIYVARILKGEKPGDLPIIQPTTYELFFKLNTARALGLTIPPSLLARADEVMSETAGVHCGADSCCVVSQRARSAFREGLAHQR